MRSLRVQRGWLAAWRRRAALGTVGFAALASAAAAPRPNLVFVLADDLGWGDVGCNGQKRIRTPNIDRLAAGGMRFTQAYAGSTVCAPSRCVLMTGLHTGHARVRGNAGKTNPAAQALRPGDVTVARVLREAGYATALIGKWGLGDAGPAESGLPLRQGFDEFYGYLNQRHAHNYYPSFLWDGERRDALRNVVPDEDPEGAGVAATRVDYSADRIAARALAFLRRAGAAAARKADRVPFFLYYASTLPHANNEAGPKGMEVPDHGEYAAADWPEPQKGHAAMIGRLDRDVGRILDLLAELGIERETLVIFSSDNGPHREGGNDPDFNDSNGPFAGIKRSLTDGGIRVPFVARWPGVVPAGAVSDQVVWFPDVLPTAAALAGARAPAGLDGVDLTATLRDPAAAPPRTAPLYWEFFERGFRQALRSGDWKLIRSGGGKEIELYDLKADPGEGRNLAAERPEVVERLGRMLDAARTDSPDWPVPPAARAAAP